MKERPILFKAEMVRAILDGRKTMTRRMMKSPKVFLPRAVRADVPGYGVAASGKHEATMNPLGAVSCLIDNGKWLGLKPGEFDWCCPYCDGETTLTESGWQIIPKESRLWVKETFRLSTSNDCACYEPCSCKVGVPIYRASCDSGEPDEKWRPSIFMPRLASRITLEVVNVRTERLQDISNEDAEAGGVFLDNDSGDFIPKYATLWESINGKGSWDANPWVLVVEFKKL
jgi:hypothetical protein